MTIDRDLQNRAARLVAAEVQCCMSSLVATLAKSNGAIDRNERDLVGLVEQAAELSYAVLDYEGAARAAGVQRDPVMAAKDDWPWYVVDEADENDEQDSRAVERDGQRRIYFETPEEACAELDVEPHELEVFEHWAVSSWLADKLEAKGERVDRDFAGLNVWARTTTGQAISADSVIEAIVTETGYMNSGEAA